MDIKFLVQKTSGAFPDTVVEYKLFDNIIETNAYVTGSIDRHLYCYLRLLLLNERFVAEVRKLRKRYGIPLNGYDPCLLINGRIPLDTLETLKKVAYEIQKHLDGMFNIDPLLKGTLDDIVAYNMIRLPLPRMQIIKPGSLVPGYWRSVINISIYESHSKEELKAFIDEKGDEIMSELRRLKRISLNADDFYVSEDDFKVYSLRNTPNKESKKPSYKQLKSILKGHSIYLEEESLRKICSNIRKKILSTNKNITQKCE